jgi:hypothetical protein
VAIRRALCEFYIKALILEDPEKDDIEIQSFLDGLMLDYPGVRYIGGLRATLEPPENFNPRRRSREVRNFLIQEGVLEYFEGKEDIRKAREVLHTPRAKEFTESMLLSQAPELAIARRLVDMHKIRGVTPAAVRLYKQYFFNTELLDSTETRALLTLKIDRLGASEDNEERLQGAALKRAYYTDPRRTAANMPHSPISAAIAQLQMGLMPDGIDLKKIAQASEFLALCRLYETVATAGHQYDSHALNLATTIRILKELRESSLNPEDELKAQLETLSIKTAEKGLPLVHDVTGGRHTVDMMALPAAKESDEQPDKK